MRLILLIILINLKIIIFKITGMTHKLVPYKVLLSITDRCNSRCLYCDIWTGRSNQTPELRIGELQPVFEDLGKNLLLLSITGGELSLVTDFKKIIDMIKAECPNLRQVSLSTNGLLSKRILDYAAHIKSIGLDVNVIISLDGDETLHDEARGIPGGYKYCMETARLLSENNINYVFNLTVGDKTLGMLDRIPNNEFNRIESFTFVHDSGIFKKKNGSNYINILKALKKIKDDYKPGSIFGWLEKIHIGIAIAFIRTKSLKNIIPCEVLNSSLHIMANGEIHPCMFMPSIGNITSHSITKVFQSEKAAKMRKRIRKNMCPHCWMACYSQYSIMQHPVRSFLAAMLTGKN